MLDTRGQKLDLLMEKSENLKFETKVYKARAKEVKKTMFLNKYKLYIILGGIVTVLVLFLILYLSSAFSSDDNKKKEETVLSVFGQVAELLTANKFLSE